MVAVYSFRIESIRKRKSTLANCLAKSKRQSCCIDEMNSLKMILFHVEGGTKLPFDLSIFVVPILSSTGADAAFIIHALTHAHAVDNESSRYMNFEFSR